VPTPDGIAFVVAENEGACTLHDFAGEDEVGFALLNFGAGEGDFVPFAEAHAHVVEKGLGAELHVAGVRPVLHPAYGTQFACRRIVLIYRQCMRRLRDL
jgi:hypothetical protein